jgi:nicotinate-nucleotide adenylyltransferase
MAPPAAQRCIAVLGGSFDPVHNGHVLLAEHFVQLLRRMSCASFPPATLAEARPAGRAGGPRGDGRRAFDRQQVPVVIDEQEIRRASATYTIDTLRALRAELGPEVSIVFLMGADQLQHLDTWQHWQELFDYAHLCAASRPASSWPTPMCRRP